MSFDPRSRRLDPRWLPPAIETSGEGTPDEPDMPPSFWDEESTDDPVGSIIAEALEEMAAEQFCVCPLCGAIVAGDGSVLG